MHAVWQEALGRLFLAPVKPEGSLVLDVGTGTGIWCMDMGDQHPSAEIFGVDLSPSQPTSVPANVSFLIEDVEDCGTWRRRFDFIHIRGMNGAITDWLRLIPHYYQNLQPGGWMEVKDLDLRLYSEDGSLRDDHALHRWYTKLNEGLERYGKSLRSGEELSTAMSQAGFENLAIARNPLPIGPWPRDTRLKTIGRYNFWQLWEDLEGGSLKPFLNGLGWARSDLETLLAEVKNDLMDPQIHSIVDSYAHLIDYIGDC